MSDRIAVMMGGEILQCAAPDVIYEDPDDIRVAEFIGSPKINILPVERNGTELTVFDQVLSSQFSFESPKDMQLGLRPEALRLTQFAPRLTGRVVHFENLGSEVFAQVALDSDGSRVTLRAMPAQRQSLGLGAQVGLTFDLSAAMIFDAEGARLRRVELAATHAPEVA